MSWVRSGDNSATYPAILEVAADPDADDRTLNEVAGFLWRCAAQTASHETDYFLLPGTAALIGGSRTPKLIQTCISAGLLIAGKHPSSGKKGWFIVEDDDFLHMVKSDEKAWENQQRNDARDPALKVPLLLRDGLLCRFCAVRTRMNGRPSKRTFTIHHLVPGVAAKDANQAVVACHGCNSAIRDDVDGSWAQQHPLMPPPRQPYIDAHAAAYLAKEGYPMSPTTGPAPDVVRAVEAVETPPQSAPAKSPPKGTLNDLKVTFEGLSQADKTTYAGSGRVGSGREGSGRGGPERAWEGLGAPVPVPGQSRPSRKRRRRRGGHGGQIGGVA